MESPPFIADPSGYTYVSPQLQTALQFGFGPGKTVDYHILNAGGPENGGKIFRSVPLMEEEGHLQFYRKGGLFFEPLSLYGPGGEVPVVIQPAFSDGDYRAAFRKLPEGGQGRGITGFRVMGMYPGGGVEPAGVKGGVFQGFPAVFDAGSRDDKGAYPRGFGLGYDHFPVPVKRRMHQIDAYVDDCFIPLH
jgi:hypothetical protein